MADKINNREVLFNPLSKNNPVVVQILGICSVLAVTAKLEPAIVMGVSVIAVLAFANVIISLLRNTILTNIRTATVGVYRTDYNELYPHGAPRGLCHGQQTMAFIS